MTHNFKLENLIINGNTFPIAYDENGIMEHSLKAIGEQLQGQNVSILCSVGVDSQLIKKLEVQLELFAQLLRLNYIQSLTVVGADTLQRHMFKIRDYANYVGHIADKCILKAADKISIPKQEAKTRSEWNNVKEEIKRLKDFTDKSPEQTERAFVQETINGIIEKLNEFCQAHSAYAEKHSDIFSELRLYLEHFDLYINLQALEQTFSSGGNVWHNETIKMLVRYADLPITIVRWGPDILGDVYSPEQITVDLAQLDLLRELEQKPPFTEQQRTERANIIANRRKELQESYEKFKQKKGIRNSTHQLVSAEKQAQNRQTLKCKEGFLEATQRTNTQYFAHPPSARTEQSRWDVWTSGTGFPGKYLQQASTDYLEEEGAFWFAERAERKDCIVYSGQPLDAMSIVIGTNNCIWVESQQKKISSPPISPTASEANLQNQGLPLPRRKSLLTAQLNSIQAQAPLPSGEPKVSLEMLPGGFKLEVVNPAPWILEWAKDLAASFHHPPRTRTASVPTLCSIDPGVLAPSSASWPPVQERSLYQSEFQAGNRPTFEKPTPPPSTYKNPSCDG